MNPTINDSPANSMTVCDADEISQNKPSIKKTALLAPALLLGDHSVSDPPDPISNSAVKPDCANGTNAQALEE